MICEVKQYVDEKTGGMVIAKIDVISEDIINYTGMAQIPIQTQQGVQGMPVEFDIKADDIGEAFLKFEDCLKEKLEQMEEEHKQQQKDQANSLIGLDGAPLDKNKNDIIDFTKGV